MDIYQSNSLGIDTKPYNWTRDEITKHTAQIRQHARAGASFQEAARRCQVPRTTAQNWVAQQQRLQYQADDADQSLIEFFRISRRPRIPPHLLGGSASGPRTNQRRRDP
jgi:hypothetical protein